MVIAVEGMHCAHCAAAVRQALMEIEGITSVSVDISARAVSFEGYADEARLRGAIDDAGFDFTGIISQ